MSYGVYLINQTFQSSYFLVMSRNGGFFVKQFLKYMHSWKPRGQKDGTESISGLYCYSKFWNCLQHFYYFWCFSYMWDLYHIIVFINISKFVHYSFQVIYKSYHLILIIIVDMHINYGTNEWYIIKCTYNAHIEVHRLKGCWLNNLISIHD